MDNWSGKAIEEDLKTGKASVANSDLNSTVQLEEATAHAPEAALCPPNEFIRIPSKVSFQRREGSRQVQAVLEAGTADQPLDLESLQALLREQGFADVMLADGALEELLARALDGDICTRDLPLRPALLKLSFSFSETDNILYAVLAQGETKQEITSSSLENWLKRKGYDSFFREADIFAKLFERLEEGRPGRFAFASKLDAEVVISLSDDKMQASITTTPAFGGTPLDTQKLRSALEEAKIDPRFYSDEILSELLAAAPFENRILARGLPPVHGNNARLIFLVCETISKKPSEDAHGNINPHELNDFVIVEPGTPVQRKEPATTGQDGYDVCGTPLPATPGKDVNFSNSLSGVGIDPADPNQLIALIKGHPLILRTVVKVDPVLHLNEVDIRSGNINFDGTVSINGDVHAGMVVTASGDVHISGIVEKARILAGNDISVRGGVIGGDGVRDGKKIAEEEHKDASIAVDTTQHVFKSFLNAGGSISARYISHAEIECGHDLVVAEYLLHSSAVVHGQVLLGQAGGKGCLIGGACHANKGIIANMLGNEHYVKTRISLGYPLKLVVELRELHEEKEKQTAILAKLTEGLHKLEACTSNPESEALLLERIEKMQHAIDLVTAELERLEQQLQALLADTTQTEAIQARVLRKTFPNVLLGINGVEHKIEKESGTGNFQLEHSKVRFTATSKAGVNISSLRKVSEH